MSDNKDQILWLDLETTGLDENNNDILEVGMIITDKNLKEIASFDMTVYQEPKALEKMNDYVKNMHTNSGLLEKVSLLGSEYGSARLAEVELQAADFISRHFPKAERMGMEERPFLHGNTIHFDRRFIKKHLPFVENLLNYRMVDVSSFKECLVMYKPGNTYKKNFAHRSLDDIRESIGEYKSYLQLLGLL